VAQFFIVVPTFNSAEYLERCLISIISMQPGHYKARIHIQDGGSSDATEEIAKRWASRGVSFASEADNGLYEAISKAATQLDDRDIMTWVGVDDYLMPGAIPTAAHIFENLDHVNWITGRPLMGIESGENFCMYPNMIYTQRALSAGKHDGRSGHFVQQEGTFWRASLWNKVGGVDTAFKLAGDWDLWRRFAQHSPLYSVESPFAKFTRREGQKSQNIDDYWAEIDASTPTLAVGDDVDHRLTRYHVGSPWLDQATDYAEIPTEHTVKPPTDARRHPRKHWLPWPRRARQS
jgi:glycosyltransferase involved in cell wall biosynthesis